ncbi:Hypothetical protein CINCED_3A013140 [Cinara cedri]|uniref:Uncharacterized protein n=1 Tax=Cinara cedri TaxID=506608 RepID=A0A5E4MX52_9HEMI|nr:Hypothetical protein CINCED_3A013140 [Cinara cedri]
MSTRLRPDEPTPVDDNDPAVATPPENAPPRRPRFIELPITDGQIVVDVRMVLGIPGEDSLPGDASLPPQNTAGEDTSLPRAARPPFNISDQLPLSEGVQFYSESTDPIFVNDSNGSVPLMTHINSLNDIRVGDQRIPISSVLPVNVHSGISSSDHKRRSSTSNSTRRPPTLNSMRPPSAPNSTRRPPPLNSIRRMPELNSMHPPSALDSANNPPIMDSTSRPSASNSTPRSSGLNNVRLPSDTDVENNHDHINITIEMKVDYVSVDSPDGSSRHSRPTVNCVMVPNPQFLPISGENMEIIRRAILPLQSSLNCLYEAVQTFNSTASAELEREHGERTLPEELDEPQSYEVKELPGKKPKSSAMDQRDVGSTSQQDSDITGVRPPAQADNGTDQDRSQDDQERSYTINDTRRNQILNVPRDINVKTLTIANYNVLKTEVMSVYSLDNLTRSPI